MREFDGYRRVAVVVIPDAPTYEERQKKREEADGKEVPDGAIMDMKGWSGRKQHRQKQLNPSTTTNTLHRETLSPAANFTLPEKGGWVDEVIFAELNEEEAKKVLEGFQKEARAAGVLREREKRERSQSREGPPNKRGREDRRGGREDRRGGRDFGSGSRDRGQSGGGIDWTAAWQMR